MTMTLVKLRYNSKLVLDPGLVLQTPLWNGEVSGILACTSIKTEILKRIGHSDGFATYNPTCAANLRWQTFHNFMATECLQKI